MTTIVLVAGAGALLVELVRPALTTAACLMARLVLVETAGTVDTGNREPSLPASPSVRSDLPETGGRALVLVVSTTTEVLVAVLLPTVLTADTGSLSWTLPPPALSLSRTVLLSIRKVCPPCLQMYCIFLAGLPGAEEEARLTLGEDSLGEARRGLVTGDSLMVV